MLNVYADVYENYLAIPVVKGRKSEKEKFAGAVATYTIEALMHDGKALQSATSHFFGDDFAKAFDIKYQGRDGKEAYPFQTSWGMTTRSIGGIIMTHGDERGLKLPPRIAPIQVVIVPFAQHKDGVLDKVNEIRSVLAKNYRVEADVRDYQTPGYKCNHWELRGVPVRVEIGPKDIEAGKCILFRRDTCEKETVALENLENRLGELLEEIQANMLEMARQNRVNKTKVATNLDEYLKLFEQADGFVKMMWCGDRACEDKLKEMTSATIRCIPFEEEHLGDKCCVCGKEAKHMVYTGKQY